MSVPVACSSCGQRFAAAPHLYGRQVRCTKCGAPIQIPHPQVVELASSPMLPDSTAPVQRAPARVPPSADADRRVLVLAGGVGGGVVALLLCAIAVSSFWPESNQQPTASADSHEVVAAAESPSPAFAEATSVVKGAEQVPSELAPQGESTSGDSEDQLLVGGLPEPVAKAYVIDFQEMRRRSERDIEDLKRRTGSQEAIRPHLPALKRKYDKEHFALLVKYNITHQQGFDIMIHAFKQGWVDRTIFTGEMRRGVPQSD